MHYISKSRKRHKNHMTVVIELEDVDKANEIKEEFQKMMHRSKHLLEHGISYNLVMTTAHDSRN